jgi:uncharacterized membrane protein
LSSLLPQVRAFYRTDTPDDQRLDLLNAHKVRFVFWGPAERALGDWDPGKADYLELVFRSGAYQIYARVRNLQ